MAKIAVALGPQPTGKRPAQSGAGRLNSRVLAQGEGWRVEDVVCTAGPQDRPFEERHAHVDIAIVVAGTFQYRGDRGCALMTPGSILLGNVGEPFECGHEHGTGDRCLSFQYSPAYFERVAADSGAGRRNASFTTLRLSPMRTFSSLAARACAGLPRGTEAPWEELSLTLAAKVLATTNATSAHGANPLASSLARVTRVVRRIENEMDGVLSLGSLAEEAGLSPYHFLRSFQHITGLTPHQYLRRARLREAAVRLVSRKAKVLDLALDCGFGDVSNFNRAFRAEFGANPSVYRISAGV